MMTNSSQIRERGNPPHLQAARIICAKHPALFSFLIDPITDSLMGEPTLLLEQAKAFSSGEQVLVAVILDLCFDSSYSRLADVVGRLDMTNFENVVKAILHLRKAKR